MAQCEARGSTGGWSQKGPELRLPLATACCNMLLFARSGTPLETPGLLQSGFRRTAQVLYDSRPGGFRPARGLFSDVISSFSVAS